MTPNRLVLRCYAANRGQHWEAFCIDLCLGAQGESFEEVRERLESQIYSYVKEAVTVDKQYVEELLDRPAPLKYRLEYLFASSMSHLGILKDGMRRIFNEALPLEPCHR